MPVSLLPSAGSSPLSSDAPRPDVDLVFAESPTLVSTLCREPLKASDIPWSFATLEA